MGAATAGAEADDVAADGVWGSGVWAGAGDPLPPMREPTAQPRRAEPLLFSDVRELLLDGRPRSSLASCTNRRDFQC